MARCRRYAASARRDARSPPRSLLAPSSREGWDDASSPRVLVRRLERGDEDKGVLSLLSQLTTVGNVTSEQFASRLLDVRNGPEFVYVVEDGGAIVAAGTLVLAGADVEAADVSGRTAFWAACALGELAVAELLAAAGADVDARDGDGLAALDFAAARGAADVLSFLRGRGARERRCRLGV